MAKFFQPKKKKEAPAPQRWFFRVLGFAFRWTFRLLLLLLLLLISLWFLIQLPAVQQFLVQKVSAYLSRELHTTVRLDRVEIDFFDRVELAGLYIEDLDHDTLLSARYCRADIELFSLFDQRLQIEGIALEAPVFHYRRKAGRTDYNLQFLVDFFSGPPPAGPEEPSKPFFFGLRNLSITELDFWWEDRLEGKNWRFKIAEGHIGIRSMDLEQQQLAISSVTLRGADIRMANGLPDEALRATLPHEEPAPAGAHTAETDTSRARPRLSIDAFVLENARFTYDEGAPLAVCPEGMDFRHLALSDIQVRFQDLLLADTVARVKLEHVSLRDHCGFELAEGKANLDLRADRLTLGGLHLETPKSVLRDSIVVEYGQFSDLLAFNENVYFRQWLDDSRLHVGEVFKFAPELRQNRFLRENADRDIFVKGTTALSSASLKTRFEIRLIGGIFLRGRFVLHGLDKKGGELLDLNLEELGASTRTLQNILGPQIISDQMLRLGNVRYVGKITGNPRSRLFTESSRIETDLGDAQFSNLELRYAEGYKLADYRGEVDIQDFALGTFLNNPDFGHATLRASIENGKGLTAETFRADLKGAVEAFGYRNYTYRAIELGGHIDARSFSGQLVSLDTNARFSFRGSISFADSLPRFALDARVDHLNLKALNLNPSIVELRGNLSGSITGDHPDNLAGELRASNVYVFDGRSPFALGAATLSAREVPQIGRVVAFESDSVSVSLSGRFRTAQLPAALQRLAAQRFPEFSQRLGIVPPPDSVAGQEVEDQSIELYAKVTDAGPLTRFVHPDLKRLAGLEIWATYDRGTDFYRVDGHLAQLSFGAITVDSAVVQARLIGSGLDQSVHARSVRIGDKFVIPYPKIMADVDRDTILFSISTGSLLKQMSPLSLGGKVFFEPGNLTLKLHELDTLGAFAFLGKKWRVDPDNAVRFWPKHFNIEHLRLHCGEESFALQDYGESGLSLLLENLSVKWLTSFVNTDVFRLDGKLGGEIGVINLDLMSNFFANIRIDSFQVNGDDWGYARLLARMPSPESFVELKQFEIISPTRGKIRLRTDKRLVAQFDDEPIYNYFSLSKNHKRFSTKHEFAVALDLKDVSPEILEYVLEQEIENVAGKVNADNVAIYGSLKDPQFEGSLRLSEARSTIKLLNTTYYIDDLICTLKKDGFYITQELLRDAEGGHVEATGAINFRRFTDFSIDLALEFLAQPRTEQQRMRFKDQVWANKVLVMDTDKAKSDVLYGKAYAKAVYLHFHGPFKNINLNITGTTAAGTNLSIPVGGTSTASAANFIRFVDKKKVGKATPVRGINVRGLNMVMDINVTPEAEASIILNESTGDVLRGRGTGALNIQYNSATSDFKLFGDYTVTQGKYLFTLSYLNVLNKQFTILPGGTVRWNGDPYNAEINLKAKYDNLSAIVYDLIANDIQTESSDVKREARKPTDVSLTMDLTGALFQPEINFDIAVPQVTPQLRSYLDARLRTIKEDKNALSQQVFGLLMMRRFLPEREPNQNAASGFESSGILTGVNTIGEMLTSQLSRYVTDALQEVLANGRGLSSIDFNVNFNLTNDGVDPTLNQNQYGSTMGAGVRTGLFNDRIFVRVGANLDVGAGYTADPTVTQTGSFVGGDFLLETLLTDDGRFRIRLYSRGENNILNNEVYRFGGGLSFRQEFDGFDDLKNWFRKKNR
jgi:hypothetical protein